MITWKSIFVIDNVGKWFLLISSWIQSCWFYSFGEAKDYYYPQPISPFQFISTANESIGWPWFELTKSHKSESYSNCSSISKPTPYMLFNRSGTLIGVGTNNSKTIAQPPRALQPNEDEGLVQLAEDPLQRAVIPLLAVPNISDLYHDAGDLIDSEILAIQNLAYKFPLKGLINATLNLRTTFPNIFSNQLGPVPAILRNVPCNPAYFPGGCTSVLNLGHSVGIPIQQLLIHTNAAQVLQRIGGTANLAHAKITRGITPEIVDFIEGDHIIQQVESVLGKISPNNIVKKSKLPELLSNITSGVVYDPLLRRHPNRLTRPTQNMMRDVSRAALACRVFNGRLPGCQPREIVTPDESPQQNNDYIIINDPYYAFRNQFGFIDRVEVEGFARACTKNRGCISGGTAVPSDKFDGIYEFFALRIMQPRKNTTTDPNITTGPNTTIGPNTTTDTNTTPTPSFPQTLYPIYRNKNNDNTEVSLDANFPLGAYKEPSIAMSHRKIQEAADLSRSARYAASLCLEPGENCVLASAFGYTTRIPADCTPGTFPVCISQRSRWFLVRRMIWGCNGAVVADRACMWSIPNVTVTPLQPRLPSLRESLEFIVKANKRIPAKDFITQ